MDEQLAPLKTALEKAGKDLEKNVSFAGRVTTRIIATAMERTIVNLWLPMKLEDYKWAIENDVTILGFLKRIGTPEVYATLTHEDKMVVKNIYAGMGAAKLVISRFGKEYVLQYLNAKYAYKWVFTRRPDLRELLKTPEGKKHFIKQIREWQRFFYPPQKNNGDGTTQ